MPARQALAAAVATTLLVVAGCADEGPPISPSATPAGDPTAPAEPGENSAESAPEASGTATEQGTDSSGPLVTLRPPGGSDGDPSGESEEDPPGAAEIVIGAHGDILPHAPVIANAHVNAGGADGEYDFAPMLADVAPLLESPDLTLCHLETPLSADNTRLTVPRTLVFRSPREVADALAGAGVDGCDFASNHTWDGGMDGLAETEQVLQDAGLLLAGPTAEESRAGAPAVYDVDGIVVAQLAYSYTLLNAGVPNTDVPEGAPWLERYLWLEVGAEGILADARAARGEGADFVVVSMHWGNEYVTEPTEQQRDLARDLLESGEVDLILGTHVHVIQPCEKIDGRYVLYGLGNFLSNQSPDTTRGGLRRATQEGMVAQVTLTRDEAGEVSSAMTYQPTRVDLDGHVIRLATPQTLPETYERTVQTVESLEDGEGGAACDAVPMG